MGCKVKKEGRKEGEKILNWEESLQGTGRRTVWAGCYKEKQCYKSSRSHFCRGDESERGWGFEGGGVEEKSFRWVGFAYL